MITYVEKYAKRTGPPMLNPKTAIIQMRLPHSTTSRMVAPYTGVRIRGKTALGMSSGLAGNGFSVHRDVITKVPYLTHSIADDTEYHVCLLTAGYRVVQSAL